MNRFLGGLLGILLLLFIGMGDGQEAAAGEIVVEKSPAGVRISTAAYVANLSAKRGYTLRNLTDRKGKRTYNFTRAGLVLIEERERTKWMNSFFPRPARHNEETIPATCTVKRGESSVRCIVEWQHELAKVQRVMTFYANSPVIEVAYTMHILKPMEVTYFRMEFTAGSFLKQGEFYPAERLIRSRNGREAEYKIVPGYSYMYDGKNGIGLLSASNGLGVALSRCVVPPRKTVYFASHPPPLRWRKVPGDISFSQRILVGLNPTAAGDYFRRHTQGLKPVRIEKLEVTKMISWPGEAGSATVILQNQTDKPQRIIVKATVETGTNQQKPLPPVTVELTPGARLSHPITWKNDFSYGATLRVEAVAEDGRVLDQAHDFFAVTDALEKVGQVTVWNPGWMHEEWLIPHLMQMNRDNYVGVVEYYCWAPDQVLDLTPDTEIFVPHTESQAVYSQPLTRTFLKRVVTEAHARGLRVLAMDTGMLSLDKTLEYPEMAKYTVDGQPYLYNGNFHRGKRFQSIGANVYTPKRIRAWAEEMCRSVEMFGWDGVRFDWGFVPLMPQDPLYTLRGKKKTNLHSPYAVEETPWYTYEGVSAKALYPDSDAIATKLVTIWRETIRKRFPRFSHNGNFQITTSLATKLPNYVKAHASNAGMLREGLLNVANDYPTWQAWSNALIDTTRVLRPIGGQPFIGYMRGYAPGGIAHRVIQYIMMASGFRWYGHVEPRYSIDDTYTRFRHALRYSRYFYSPEFQIMPATTSVRRIQLAGKETTRILWRPFCYIRKDKRGEAILVHLINLPPQDKILIHHPIPVPKHDLTLRVKASGEVASCVLLVPEPTPHAIPLKIRREGEEVLVTITELSTLGSVVLQMKP